MTLNPVSIELVEKLFTKQYELETALNMDMGSIYLGLEEYKLLSVFFTFHLDSNMNFYLKLNGIPVYLIDARNHIGFGV